MGLGLGPEQGVGFRAAGPRFAGEACGLVPPRPPPVRRRGHRYCKGRGHRYREHPVVLPMPWESAVAMGFWEFTVCVHAGSEKGRDSFLVLACTDIGMQTMCESFTFTSYPYSPQH